MLQLTYGKPAGYVTLILYGEMLQCSASMCYILQGACWCCLETLVFGLRPAGGLEDNTSEASEMKCTKGGRNCTRSTHCKSGGIVYAL